jgi:hypothetical protein
VLEDLEDLVLAIPSLLLALSSRPIMLAVAKLLVEYSHYALGEALDKSVSVGFGCDSSHSSQ